MENGFKIMGQNLSPERKEKFAQKYKEIEKEAMTPYANELEKSEKAKEIISFINVCLKKNLIRWDWNMIIFHLKKSTY